MSHVDLPDLHPWLLYFNEGLFCKIAPQSGGIVFQTSHKDHGEHKEWDYLQSAITVRYYIKRSLLV